MASSRRKRMDEALDQIEAEVGDLEALREEYQDWLDGLPENLSEGPTADKLDEATEVLDQAVTTFTETLEAVRELDLPLGFGRD